ncbi:hypothetical protein Tco_0499744 [Tanacetum coccineum]
MERGVVDGGGVMQSLGGGCGRLDGRSGGWDERAVGGDDRKVHLVEEKEIPNVGVFCIWKAFGRNTRDLGSFGEETDKTTDLHQHCSRISLQKLETASQITRDAATTISKTASQDLKTVSDCTTQPII